MAKQSFAGENLKVTFEENLGLVNRSSGNNLGNTQTTL